MPHEDIERDLAEGILRDLRDYLASDDSLTSQMEIARRWLEASERLARRSPHGEIGPYVTLGHDPIGRGGQGEVYLCEDRRLARRVAVKVLRRGAVGSEHSVERFIREGRLAARLDHPGLCGVLDTGVHDGHPFLVMPWIDGKPLSKVLADSSAASDAASFVVSLEPTASTSTSTAAQPDAAAASVPSVETICIRVGWIQGVARALHSAHQAGLVHRDVKPANIMIDRDGRAIVMDFGLAKDEASDVTLTQTGEFIGTLAYMSPEQLLAQRVAVDRRSDIYSLGVTLYECVAGRRPWDGRSTKEVAAQITFAAAPPIRSLNHHVGRDLAIVIETAMQHDPARRYQTALDFAEDLRRVQNYEPIVARPVPTIVRLWLWARRHPTTAVLSSVVFVLLIAGIVGLRTKNAELESRSIEISRQSKLAKERYAEVRRLADIELLKEAERASEDLWPIGRDLVARLDAWRAKYGDIGGRLPQHVAALDNVVREEGEETTEEAARFREWKRDLLTDLVARLRAFVDPDDGLLAEIERRRERSSSIHQRTIIECEKSWLECIERVRRNSRYSGLDLAPREGLVPLGPDPSTHFEEFLHLESQASDSSFPMPADRRKSMRPTPGLGIVFVLVPGGEFDMGAQSNDTGAANFDAEAERNESPVRRVIVAPCFLSKYELTRGQWMRLSGRPDPSNWTEETSRGLIHSAAAGVYPVDQVSWEDCRDVLRRSGVRLPTEAEWEHACRAGHGTPWSFGSDRSEFVDFANLADAQFSKYFRVNEVIDRETDDGHALPAPVGTFRPNDFGLHDMHGNLWEWCEDFYESTDQRLMRGGSFYFAARYARSSYRERNAAAFKSFQLGVRPAMSVMTQSTR